MVKSPVTLIVFHRLGVVISRSAPHSAAPVKHFYTLASPASLARLSAAACNRGIRIRRLPVPRPAPAIQSVLLHQLALGPVL